MKYLLITTLAQIVLPGPRKQNILRDCEKSWAFSHAQGCVEDVFNSWIFNQIKSLELEIRFLFFCSDYFGVVIKF